MSFLNKYKYFITLMKYLEAKTSCFVKSNKYLPNLTYKMQIWIMYHESEYWWRDTRHDHQVIYIIYMIYVHEAFLMPDLAACIHHLLLLTKPLATPLTCSALSQRHTRAENIQKIHTSNVWPQHSKVAPSPSDTYK